MDQVLQKKMRLQLLLENCYRFSRSVAVVTFANIFTATFNFISLFLKRPQTFER